MQISFERGRWSPATRVSYDANWRQFDGWCKARGKQPIPASPETVAEYLEARAADLSTSTLSQHLAAIKAAHDMCKALNGTDTDEAKRFILDMKHPALADTWKEIRRTKGTRQVPKTPLLYSELVRIIPQIASYRDKAVLLLGFGLALRRSEIVALNVDDLVFTREGVQVTIRRSKTDQEGKGVVLKMPRTNAAVCPVVALEAWLREGKRTSGPVFTSRTGKRLEAPVVALTVKRAVMLIGKDPKTHAGHSLRRGFVTTAFESGAPIESVKEVSRHVGTDMLLRYKEASALFDSPAQRAVWGLAK